MASLIYPAPETATSTRENNDTASICGTGVRAKSRFVTAQRCHSCYLLCGRSFPGSALNRSAVTPSGTLIHKFHPAAVPCCPVAGVSISRGGGENSYLVRTDLRTNEWSLTVGLHVDCLSPDTGCVFATVQTLLFVYPLSHAPVTARDAPVV